MKRALLVVTMLLTACDQSPTNCKPPSIVPSAPPVEVTLVNEPVTIELLGLLQVFCEKNGPVANDVVVTVRDAHGVLVDETHTSVQPRSNGFSTEVTFTPTTPGTYVLEARFEPSVASVKQLHVVADDRATDQPELISMIDQRCTTIHPLGNSLLCLSSRGAEVWVDGGVVDSLPGWPLETDDGVSWLFLGNSVMRLEAVDGGIRRDSLALPFHPVGMSADREHIVQVDAFVQDIVFSDGGLEHRPRAIAKAPESYPLMIARAGDNLAAASSSQLCSLGATATTFDCRVLHNFQRRTERNVVWFSASETPTIVEQFRVNDDSTTELRAFPSSPRLELAPQSWPLFTWNRRFATVRPDDLSLELWPKLDGVVTVTITPSHVAFQTSTNQVFVYRR